MGAACSGLPGGRRARVLLLGLDSAGKTTVLNCVKGSEAPAETEPTVGFTVERMKFKKPRKMEVAVWDVSGQDKARPFWRHYYRGTSGILFVVDSNDTQRIPNARAELFAILEEVELEEAVIAVLANKRDLPEAEDMESLRARLGIEEVRGAGREIEVFETVARDGTGVTDAFDWLAERIKPLGT